MSYLIVISLSFFIYSCTTEEITPSDSQEEVDDSTDETEKPSNEVVDKEISLGNGQVFNMKYFMISINQILFNPSERKRMFMTHDIDKEGIINQSFWNFSYVGSFGNRVVTMQHSLDSKDVINSSTIEIYDTQITYEYIYDEKGLISSMNESAFGILVNRYNYEYNEKNQLMKKQNINNNVTYSFVYNTDGKIISLTEEFESIFTTYNYSYDAQGYLLSEKSNWNYKRDYKYDNQGRISESLGGTSAEYLSKYEYTDNQLTLKIYPPENSTNIYIRKDEVYMDKITNLKYFVYYYEEFAIKGLLNTKNKIDERQYFTNNNFDLKLVGNSKVDSRYRDGYGHKKQESFYNTKGDKIYVITYTEEGEFTYYKGDGTTKISKSDITEQWVLELLNH
ncbi:hypothetical protein [Flammeovirga sp. SJP92]|uniref:hypothetical protein n=1 Tax=Flammeovirga sp. SJP92 TaxID=1775430 RepID=UPI00078884AD|nr:hypothetical protein [Flammeovirga sp. SJP92]KXX71532.1 hypothetical protein AVL50_04480 [Flammeovirga sp. SJP92]